MVIEASVGRLRELVATIKRKRFVVKVNLPWRGESDVGNKHAYFMHWQNHSGGLGEIADAACNRNAYPDPACSSCGNLGRNFESPADRCGRRGVRRVKRTVSPLEGTGKEFRNNRGD
jgi:hypothetical protein